MENKKSPVQRDAIPAHVRHHLTSQPQSGLSIPLYCNRHSVSTWSFYQWRKRYRSKLNGNTAGQPVFTDLGILGHSACVCDIRFPSGITISVRRGTSRDELAAIIELVGASYTC